MLILTPTTVRHNMVYYHVLHYTMARYDMIWYDIWYDNISAAANSMDVILDGIECASSMLPGHRIRGWIAVSAAGLQGSGSHATSCFSETPVSLVWLEWPGLLEQITTPSKHGAAPCRWLHVGTQHRARNSLNNIMYDISSKETVRFGSVRFGSKIKWFLWPVVHFGSLITVREIRWTKWYMTYHNTAWYMIQALLCIHVTAASRVLQLYDTCISMIHAAMDTCFAMDTYDTCYMIHALLCCSGSAEATSCPSRRTTWSGRPAVECMAKCRVV